MSLSKVIDDKYRLGPEDVGAGEMKLTVTNVTFQGLEHLRPVLHFKGLAKQMVCDPGQCNELARMSSSAICTDWIGIAVTLKVVDDVDGQPALQLSPAATLPPAMADGNASARGPAPWLQTVALVLLLATLFVLVYLFENNGALLDQIFDLF